MPASVVWKTRLRFALFLLPRELAGRCSVTRMAGYVLDALNSGNDRIAEWCMNRAILGTLDAPDSYRSILAQFLHERRFEAAAAYAHGVFDAGGLIATEAARLTGELVLGNANAAALFTFDRLLTHCRGNLSASMPAPSPPQPVDSKAIHEWLATLSIDSSNTNRELREFHLAMARFCFSFAAFDTAARLFEVAAENATLADEDRIARVYAQVKSDAPAGSYRRGGMRDELATMLSRDPDWQGLLATAQYARLATEELQAGIDSAVRRKFEQLQDLDEVAADVRHMVGRLSACRKVLVFTVDESRAAAGAKREYPGSNANHAETLFKVFICGNGWSGSGALYDAISDYDGVKQAPDLSIDSYINECTDNEMMFVQGTNGLGRIWRQVRDEQQIHRMDLWEFFRFHVIGLGAIGHTEHKSANAASNLVRQLGSRYTSIFRRAIDRIADLPDGSTTGSLRAILVDTTEQLTRTLTGASSESCVIFNNAMFGPNLDMVEIFSSFKLAVVVRDPLDQFADRRAQDLKHWMSARRFVPFYRSSRNAFHIQKNKLPPALATAVREVEFERFVRDEEYRHEVISWSMGDRVAGRIRNQFDAHSSIENIGIHAKLLKAQERQIIDKELGEWRRS